METKNKVSDQIESAAVDIYKGQLLNVVESDDKGAIEELFDEKMGLRVSDIQEDTYKTIKFDVCQLISNFNVQHNAVSGAFMSYFFDALMDEKPKKLSEEECLKISGQAANLQQGAVLDTCGYEKHGGYENFIARWRHDHNSILVEKDFVHVVMNGRTGKVISVVNKWHEVNVENSQR